MTQSKSPAATAAAARRARTAAAAKKKSAPQKRATPTPEVSAKPAASPKPDTATAETVHVKVVRDGFTMPKGDYDTLKALKALCLQSGVDVKKSELLRAGILALAAMPATELLGRMRALPAVKAGRKKNKV